MANIASAKKAVRSNERRRLRNRMHIGRARSEVKRARVAIASGDVAAATAAVSEASRWLDHAASKGSLHRGNASRRKGRLMRHLAEMQASPVAADASSEAVETEKPKRRAKKASA